MWRDGRTTDSTHWRCVSFHVVCTVHVGPQHLVGDPRIEPMRSASDSLERLEEMTDLPNGDQNVGKLVAENEGRKMQNSWPRWRYRAKRTGPLMPRISTPDAPDRCNMHNTRPPSNKHRLADPA